MAVVGGISTGVSMVFVTVETEAESLLLEANLIKRGGQVLRPTVWQIYKDANGNQAAAIDALKRFGYVR